MVWQSAASCNIALQECCFSYTWEKLAHDHYTAVRILAQNVSGFATIIDVDSDLAGQLCSGMDYLIAKTQLTHDTSKFVTVIGRPTDTERKLAGVVSNRQLKMTTWGEQYVRVSHSGFMPIGY